MKRIKLIAATALLVTLLAACGKNQQLHLAAMAVQVKGTETSTIVSSRAPRPILPQPLRILLRWPT